MLFCAKESAAGVIAPAASAAAAAARSAPLSVAAAANNQNNSNDDPAAVTAKNALITHDETSQYDFSAVVIGLSSFYVETAFW